MTILRPATRHLCRILPIKRLQRLSTATAEPISSDAHHHQPSNNQVKIIEVGPRDGLQNEQNTVPLTTKIELIERLAKTGLTNIEAGSFVAPKWVPQMANSSEILEYILKTPPASAYPIAYSFLAPNRKGLANALATLHAHPNAYSTLSSSAQPTILHEPSQSSSLPQIELAVFAAATESFSQKNLNTSIASSLEAFRQVINTAKEGGIRVRAYISVVLGCPFEGHDVSPQKVAEIACDLMEMGADEISLGDTTGMGTAPRTRALLHALASAGIRTEDIAMHFHDTYGQALVNVAVSLENGIRRFDGAVGGLGGCPYSPGATGNVSSEDLVYFFESLGMDTGVDLDRLCEIGEWITGQIGKKNASSVGKAVSGKMRKDIGNL